MRVSGREHRRRPAPIEPAQVAGSTDRESKADHAPGRRERNKNLKEIAIRQAARKLFIEKGFEATTLKQVAAEADVGLGTVSTYAVDKAGLLAMVYVEELYRLPPLFPIEQEPKELLNELLDGMTQLYDFWAAIPSLNRHVLQQLEFYSSNPYLEEIIARRRQTRSEIGRWLADRQLRKIIRPDISTEDAADCLFAIYTSALREWVAGEPSNVGTGIRRLRRLMMLPLDSLRSGS